MPINKSAYLRYQTLNNCFRNRGRKYSLQELIDAVGGALSRDNPDFEGIAKRTIQDDIAFMRSTDGFDAPIESLRDGKQYHYSYSDKNFSINNVPITETETAQLRAALNMLSRFEGAPQFEWLSEIMPVLSDRFKLEGNKTKVMGFDSNLDYKGNEHITTLFNAIVNKRVLSIDYKPYRQIIYNITFHPSYLKQYNNRWFVFGRNANPAPEQLHIADTWNMALDRITKIRELTDPYQPIRMDWEEEFFSDFIGVTKKSETVEEVELWIAPEQAPYVTTKSIHRSQKKPIQHGDGSITIRLMLIPNFELEQVILSFGERAKVLKPAWLAETIKKRLENAVGNY